MINDPSKKISIVELKARIRAQIAKRKADPQTTFWRDGSFRSAPGHSAAARTVHEAKIWFFLKKIQKKLKKYPFYCFIHEQAIKLKKYVPRYYQQFSLGDLLKYRDEDFIKNAFRTILQREPDYAGFNDYLRRLRSGDLHRVEIIGRLNYSREGRENHVKIKGLLLKYSIYTAYRIPIIGYLLKITVSLLNMPSIMRQAQEYEAFTDARFTQNAGVITQLFSGHQSNLHIIEEHSCAVSEIKNDLAGKADAQLVNNINREVETVLFRIRDHKLHILDQQMRLAQFLEEAGKRLPEPFSSEQLRSITAEEDHLLDAMYVSFEERFRGSRDDIKQRAKVYLQLVDQAHVGTSDAPVLDIGCGRGEWLELLKENGYVAKGIDLNRVMIADCAERGFDARESDAIEYLKNQAPNSFGAITGFHFIEHLPHKTLIKLFDESRRVLKSGGVLIFETPNPENLMVGACNFYVDPTHIRPLPPITIQFIAEARGFERVSVKRLTEHRIEEAPPEADRLTRQAYYTAPDYALIAYKA